MTGKSKYSEKLRDPRWQKKRLEILNRDDFTCRCCYDIESTLHVHHLWYERGKDPWEYPDICYITLCEECHASEGMQRGKEEAVLLDALRRQHFLSSDINDIAISLMAMERVKPPEVTAHVIAWAIDNIRLVDELYFDTILSKKKDVGEDVATKSTGNQ